MPDENEDNFDEAEEIINESDESVEGLVADDGEDLTADTEQYDEAEDIEDNDFIDEAGDPEELDFEPADDNFAEDDPEPDDAA